MLSSNMQVILLVCCSLDFCRMWYLIYWILNSASQSYWAWIFSCITWEIFLLPTYVFAFQESYSKKRGYALEAIPSVPLDAVPSENDSSLCDSIDIAVTKKPCSLEIARVPSSRPGKSPNNALHGQWCKC